MFDKTIDRKPTIVDSTGTVIKDLTVPIYKRTNQFQLNYTVTMTTLEQQMRPDLISTAEYGTDKHTEDILKLNGITNPFSMDTAQIIMVFDEKDIENLSKTDNSTKLLEPYKRLQDPKYINNRPNDKGTGYDNTPVKYSGINQSLLNSMDRSNITPDLKNRLPLIDTKKPYSKFDVDPITKKFINPDKLPEFGLNLAFDKITVGGKKKVYKRKEPNINNDDKNQFTIKDGKLVLGPERDKDSEGEYIPNINDPSNDNTIDDNITNTENLPEDIKDLIDEESDCNSGENKCKDKYPEAFKEYLANRDLKLEDKL